MSGLRRLALATLLLVCVAVVLSSAEAKKRGSDRGHQKHQSKPHKEHWKGKGDGGKGKGGKDQKKGDERMKGDMKKDVKKGGKKEDSPPADEVKMAKEKGKMMGKKDEGKKVVKRDVEEEEMEPQKPVMKEEPKKGKETPKRESTPRRDESPKRESTPKREEMKKQHHPQQQQQQHHPQQQQQHQAPQPVFQQQPIPLHPPQADRCKEQKPKEEMKKPVLVMMDAPKKPKEEEPDMGPPLGDDPFDEAEPCDEMGDMFKEGIESVEDGFEDLQEVDHPLS